MNVTQLRSLDYWGDIPENWQLIPIKYGFNLIGSGTTPPTGQEEYFSGSVPWVTTSELRENFITSTTQTVSELAIAEFSALKIFPENTVLIAMYGATIGRVAILGIPACVNQAVCALSQPICFEPRYVSYTLQVSRDYLLSLASGGGQPNLNAEKIKSHYIPCPSLSKQCAIANYLDRETAKIDTLISKKECLLDLLAEKRQALIFHFVTRGINHNSSIHDSGFEWIGEIPTHWEVVKVKYVAKVGNGSTPLRAQKAYWDNGKFPWLTSTVVNDEVVGEPTEFVTEIALQECHLPIVKTGSVLVAITGEGKTRGKASLLLYNATINQHLAFIYPQENVLIPEFLQLFLSSSYEILRMISEGTGSTKGALTCEQLSEFFIPLPPLIEQQRIIKTILQNKINIDTLNKVTLKTIVLLKERRTTLIKNAVLGKIRSLSLL